MSKLICKILIIFLASNYFFIPEASAQNTKTSKTQETKQSSLSEKEEIAAYLAGKKAIDTQQEADYQSTLNILKDSDLQPYLQAYYFQKNLTQLDSNTIISFLKTFPSKAFSASLRRSFISNLYAQSQWQVLLDFIKMPKNTSEQCMLRTAQLKLGNMQAALQDYKQEWLKDFGDLDECKALESSFITEMENGKAETGSLDNNEALIETKLETALLNNKLEVAQKLLPLIRNSDIAMKYRNIVGLFSDLNKVTGDIKLYEQQEKLYANLIIYYAKKRSSVEAQQIFDQWLITSQINTEHPAIQEAQTQLAVYQAGRNDSSDALKRILQIPFKQRNEELNQWGFRLSAKQGKWKQAFDFLLALSPETLAADPTWYYWLGVSAQAINRTEQAQQYWLKIADSASFYGFLAADQLQKKYTELLALKNQAKPPVTTLKEGSLFLTSLKLLAVNEETWARSEWVVALKTQTEDEILGAAQTAYAKKYYEFGLRAAVYAKKAGTLDLRYPIAYKDIISKENANYNFPEAIILGLIRQESLFQANAVSPAKAYGLMQLLDDTANATAKALGENKRGSLFNPNNNIRYGLKYLSILADEKVGRKWSEILSAYNAGPNKTLDWRNPDIDTLLWIECIPFKETRNYVKSILSNAVIYSYLLNQPRKISDYLQDF